MFCSKCGREIMDEAVVCPNCGCATNNYATNNAYPSTAYSKDYTAIKMFYDEARTLRNLGIVAAVLMFGIGIIFSIIIWIKSSSIQEPKVTTTNPAELAVLETAKKYYNSARNLSSLPIVGMALGFILGGLIGMIASL